MTEEKVSTQPEAPQKKASKPPKLYRIYSLVRDVSTRVERAKSPDRHRFKMILGGGMVRLVRKRPTTVTEEALLRMRSELIEKERRGMLKVTDMVGRRLNLESLELIDDRPAEPKAPHPPLDSAARDTAYPVGEAKAMFPQGLPETADVEPPKVIQPELPEGKDAKPEEAEAETEDEEESSSEEPETSEGEPALVSRRRRKRR